MQRLFSRRLLRSSVVSFLSLPSLLVRSGLELEEDWLLVAFDEPEELPESVVPCYWSANFWLLFSNMAKVPELDVA